MKKDIYRRILALFLVFSLVLMTVGCGKSKDQAEDFDEDEQWEETEEEDWEYPEEEDEEVVEEADASEEDSEEGTWDYEASDMGIVLHLPMDYDGLQGNCDFSNYDVTGGEGFFIGQMDYYGLNWQELSEKADNDEITEEDEEKFLQSTVPVFTILGADQSKSIDEVVETLNEYLEESMSADRMTLLKEVDGFCFYQYTPESPKNYQNLEETYLEEYNRLSACNDTVLANADYSRPQTLYEKMMGNEVSFTTTDLDGNTVTSDEIFSQNEITMINVWATWCGWCVGELGELEQINKELGSRDCAIVGLCGDATDDATIGEAKSILNENGVTYLNICPYDGWNDTFEMDGWPTSFFVDRNGKIVTTPISGAKVDAYVSHVDEALKGNTGAVVKETNSYGNSEGAYRIIVADEASAPVPGVMVQFCTADTCQMQVTDGTGTATFNEPPGEYDVHILKVPEGYQENDTGYKTESFHSDMVIVLDKK